MKNTKARKIAVLALCIFAGISFSIYLFWPNQNKVSVFDDITESKVLEIDDVAETYLWLHAGVMLGSYPDIIDIWITRDTGMMFLLVKDSESYIASYFNVTEQELATKNILWGWHAVSPWNTELNSMFGLMFRNGTNWFGFTSIRVTDYTDPVNLINIIQSQQGL